MITRLGTTVLAAALALPAICQAQSTTWELGHPDAKLLMGIDLKGLRESPVGQTMRAQWKAQPQAIGPAGMAMGFLEQVDSIFISSPSLSNRAASRPLNKTGVKTPVNAAAATENPPFLAVVQGRLPIQQLLAFLPGTSHRYHDVEIFKGAKANDASIAALDTRTIVLGDEKSVLAAIDRRGHPLAPTTPIIKRAQELASTHEVWVIVEESLSKFQPATPGAAETLASKIASQIKGLDMGMSVHDGFEFQMSLGTETEAAAQQMSQLLGGQLALMAQSPAIVSQPNGMQAAEMLKRLHIETDGARMRLSFALSTEEVAEQMRVAQAAIAARQATGQSSGQTMGQPMPQPVKSQPKPVTPGKVKIYGLEGGVREIQLTH